MRVAAVEAKGVHVVHGALDKLYSIGLRLPSYRRVEPWRHDDCLHPALNLRLLDRWHGEHGHCLFFANEEDLE